MREIRDSGGQMSSRCLFFNFWGRSRGEGTEYHFWKSGFLERCIQRDFGFGCGFTGPRVIFVNLCASIFETPCRKVTRWRGPLCAGTRLAVGGQPLDQLLQLALPVGGRPHRGAPHLGRRRRRGARDVFVSSQRILHAIKI